MNFNFLKFRLPIFKAGKIKRNFSLNPLDLWKKFIWFLIFFALLMFIFNGWVFYKFYFMSANREAPDDNTLKLHSFNKAVEHIEDKAKKFEGYKNNLIIEDPS